MAESPRKSEKLFTAIGEQHQFCIGLANSLGKEEIELIGLDILKEYICQHQVICGAMLMGAQMASFMYDEDYAEFDDKTVEEFLMKHVAGYVLASLNLIQAGFVASTFSKYVDVMNSLSNEMIELEKKKDFAGFADAISVLREAIDNHDVGTSCSSEGEDGAQSDLLEAVESAKGNMKGGE